MMEPNEIMMSLRGAAARWEAMHPIIGVGQLRVHDALNDAADCIERLQAELETSQRREMAAIAILNSIGWVGSGAKGRIEDAIGTLRDLEQEGE